MAADTERLFVQLEARISEFEKRMAKAERRGTRTYNQLQRGSRSATRRMERDMTRASGRINTALASTATAARTVQRSMMMIGLPFIGAAGVGAITRGVRGAVSDLSDLGKTARDVSLDVEDLQGLMRGFERNSRVTGEAAAQAFERFNRRVGEAANGTGEFDRIVERYGIRLRRANGELRDQGDLLREVANAIRGASNDQERAAIAQAAFGDVGRQMADAMREGSGALDRMIRDAIDAGDVIDRDLINRAEELDDRFDALTRRVGTFFKTLAVGAADSFMMLSGAVDELNFTADEIAQVFGQDFAAELERAGEVSQEAQSHIAGLAIEYDELIAQARDAVGIFSNAAATMQGLGDEATAQEFTRLAGEMEQLAQAYEDGSISAEDLRGQMAIANMDARDLVESLGDVDQARLSNVTLAVDGLTGALARVIEMANQAAAAVNAIEGTGVDPASQRRAAENDAQTGALERRRAREELEAFLDTERERAARTREQIELERELELVQRRAREEGVELTEAQARAQARANLELQEAAGGSGGAGGGSGGRSGGQDGFARMVASIRERTQAMQMEAEAITHAAASGRDYASAMQFAQTRARLLSAAQSEGLAITPELTSAIDELANAYVRAGDEAQGAADRMREAEENAQRGASAISDLFSALADDSRDATKVLAGLLRQMAEVQFQRAMMGIAKSGSGGGFFGMVGSLLGFSSGGFTGAGGTNEPKGVVHAGEYVVRASQVNKPGVLPLLEAINSGLPGFARGGLVAPGCESGPEIIIERP